MKQSSVSEASIYKYIRETFNPFAIIQEASHCGFILKKIEDTMGGKKILESTEKDDKGQPKQTYSGVRKGFYEKFFDNQPNVLKAIQSQLLNFNQQ